jgi:hypothetical protein
LFGKTKDDHENALKAVFQKLRESNLILNREKCEFYKVELKYMGHTLSQDGIKVDSEKIKVVQEAVQPGNVQEVPWSCKLL